MTIENLRKVMMEAKKSNPEEAKVYQSILATAQLIAKEDGNRGVQEKDISLAAKKEMKMAQQSKDAGAPYSELTFVIGEKFLPKLMNNDELTVTIETIISSLVKNGNQKSPKLMGQIMKILKNEYTDMYDGKLASTLTKSLLSK